jgi:hypothetical protein
MIDPDLKVCNPGLPPHLQSLPQKQQRRPLGRLLN